MNSSHGGSPSCGQVQALISSGVEEGATLVAGGLGRPEGLPVGYYCKPTVFADVSNCMRIAREEIFGPVLSIMPFEDEAEAVGACTCACACTFVCMGDMCMRMCTRLHVNGCMQMPLHTCVCAHARRAHGWAHPPTHPTPRSAHRIASTVRSHVHATPPARAVNTVQVRIANDTAFGLTSYVHTGCQQRARRVSRQLRAGMVVVNGAARAPGSPFGGMRQSGKGREGGTHGLREFLEVKAIAGYL